MLVGLVSAAGSPGVTTSALAMAAHWPRLTFVLEADPFGGDIRAGLGRGEWPPSAGLAELAIDLRSGTLDQALGQRLHRPAAHAPLILAGLGCLGQAPALPWSRLGPALGSLPGADVVADCGRFVTADGVLPLLRTCNAVVLVTRSSLRAARAAARVAPVLQDELRVGPGDARVSALVVCPDQPYSADEIAAGCRLPLLGELPDDPRTAAVWSDGDQPGRSFARRPLQREAGLIAGRVAGLSAGRGAA